MSNNQLEEEFVALMDSVGEEIAAQIKIATEALRKATELSDQHGIPFYANVSELGQPYVPYSFTDKWKGLDKNLVASYTEVHPGDLSDYNNGWSTSQVC